MPASSRCQVHNAVVSSSATHTFQGLLQCHNHVVHPPHFRSHMSTTVCHSHHWSIRPSSTAGIHKSATWCHAHHPPPTLSAGLHPPGPPCAQHLSPGISSAPFRATARLRSSQCKRAASVARRIGVCTTQQHIGICPCAHVACRAFQPAHVDTMIVGWAYPYLSYASPRTSN
jgi:hypothetical protein